MIRYRTGDRASWLSGPCGRGSVLRRLGKVQGRFHDVSSTSMPLSVPILDEAIFSLLGIFSFHAGCRVEDNGTVLDLTLFCKKKNASRIKEEVDKVVGIRWLVVCWQSDRRPSPESTFTRCCPGIFAGMPPEWSSEPYQNDFR